MGSEKEVLFNVPSSEEVKLAELLQAIHVSWPKFALVQPDQYLEDIQYAVVEESD